MCKNCVCDSNAKPVQYKCDCNDDTCTCEEIIGFDQVPNTTLFCCNVPMERIK
jgi:hypothetical protein